MVKVAASLAVDQIGPSSDPTAGPVLYAYTWRKSDYPGLHGLWRRTMQWLERHNKLTNTTSTNPNSGDGAMQCLTSLQIDFPNVN